MTEYITDKIEIDVEDFNEKNSDEENYNEET